MKRTNDEERLTVQGLLADIDEPKESKPTQAKQSQNIPTDPHALLRPRERKAHEKLNPPADQKAAKNARKAEDSEDEKSYPKDLQGLPRGTWDEMQDVPLFKPYH